MSPFTFVLPLLITGVINKKKNNKKTMPTFKGIIEVKHILSGRIRYNIPSLKGDQQKIDNLKKIVNDFDNIISVEGSANTGSLLILFDKIEPELITGLLIHLLDLKDAIEKPVVGSIYQKISSVSKSLNRGIYEETNGLLDIDSIITFSLGFFGIKYLIKNPLKGPGSWTLLWWLYNATMNIERKSDL